MRPWFKRVGLVTLLVLVCAFAYQRIAALARTSSTVAIARGISGTDLSGKTWALAEHLGKRPVVINFFGTR